MVNYITHDPLCVNWEEWSCRADRKPKKGCVDGYFWFLSTAAGAILISTFYFLLLLQEVRRCCLVAMSKQINIVWPSLNALKKKGTKIHSKKKKSLNNRALPVCQSVPRGRCCGHTCIQSLIMATSEPGYPSKCMTLQKISSGNCFFFLNTYSCVFISFLPSTKNMNRCLNMRPWSLTDPNLIYLRRVAIL